MIDLLPLIKQTNGYRAVEGDKKRETLSHAYLILTADKDCLDEYMKIFARLLLCREEEPCGRCRICNLINKNAYSDVYFYPKNGESVTAEEVTELIEESYVKPIEGKEKVFVISHAENMNLSAQNKLLKTLEEPPSGVHILIGATSEFALLPTVKSRVKKIEIPMFSSEKLFSALKDECPDSERLSQAVACGDGTVGNTLSLYADENLKAVKEVAVDTLVNLKSSSEVLQFSNKILAVDPELKEYISVLELLIRDLLAIKLGEERVIFNRGEKEQLIKSENFSVGALLSALDGINEGRKRKKFNANATMLIEWLLFKILEGKYKWQKL